MILLTNPKQLFLIDGIGALVSAFFLGVILVVFEPLFGMPKGILYWLAAIPCLFALYSFNCYFFLRNYWRFYLKIITIANGCYCCVTIWLMYCHYQSLTLLGVGYFVAELLVLGILIAIELKVSFKSAEV